jgi:uncharacterized membrane protein YjgN (DUF898 family)
MNSFWRDFKKGAGYLEHYGHHPGNMFIFLWTVLWLFFLVNTFSVGMSSVLFATTIYLTLAAPWVIGCILRAREHERIYENVSPAEKQCKYRYYSGISE